MASDPIPASELEDDFQGYVTAMRAQNAALPASFFRIKQAGRLTTGIGSALDEKYLLRIEGFTPRQEDDQLLEAKLVRTLPGAGCLHTDGGPGRVTRGMALIASASFRFSGLFARGGRPFWTHGWADDYVELSVECSFPESNDLRQVAYDVGIQLGRAHPRHDPGEVALAGSRSVLLESTSTNEDRIRAAIAQLTEATVEAWEAFRGGAGERSLPAEPGIPPGANGTAAQPEGNLR